MSPVQLQNFLQQGVTHHRAGRLAEALACYTRVRGAAPRSFDAWHLSGVVALQLGRTADAVAWLERAVMLDPKSAPAAMRLGLALIGAGRSAEAEPQLRRAVQLKPDFVEGWDNLAYCLKTLDRLPDAIECHERAMKLAPGHAVGWYNYGLTLSLHGRVTDALACHDRALAADPNYARGHFGRAQALQQAHRLPEAIAAYGDFLAREPRHHEARSYRLFALNYLDHLTREQLFAEHVAFGEAVGEFPRPDFAVEPDPARKLRVAILSPDLRAHSCAYFIEPLLRHLPRESFEVHLYHDHFRTDAVSQRLRALASGWRSFVGQPNAVVEQTIRADAPDILIDLAGHTGMTNRLAVFARHVAPVQITYLGYPNTTGLRAMHYRFTDEHADPFVDADAYATERLVRFAPTAWAYEPPEKCPEVNALPASVPGAPVRFGSFNNLAKLTDSLLAVWARVLAATPDSRLVLKGRGLSDATVRARYAARFAAAGLPADRVDLLERTAATEDHLALYHGIDIALDTFPYHGTTTTCEALWMGCPVVTLRGDRHVARVGASLLHAVGHPEWIAENPDEYVACATALAADRAALAQHRARLRDEMRASPLLDHAGQAERFGAALRACWAAWCESHAPAATA
jgi:predicted O-linked N-acetylglucosamine transferase (SPINDLY family)